MLACILTHQEINREKAAISIIMFRFSLELLFLASLCLVVTSFRPSATRYLHMVVPMQQSRDGNFQRQQRPQIPSVPINEYIKADRVRLIVPGNETDTDGEQSELMLGIFSIKEALEKAETYNLDLVLINDKADPPVCKVIDYGKFKYSQEKKKKENMKKQIKMEIKEVKMSYKIDQHDFDVRMRAVQKFLADGDRVKVVVQFKGREMQHKDLGRDLLMKIYQPIEETTVMESAPKVEGRAMSMLLGSKKVV